MSNNKQSSIEWLMEQICEKQPNGFYVIDTLDDVQKVLEQAKAMHKEEISKAFNRGRFWNNSWDGKDYYEEVIIKGNDW